MDNFTLESLGSLFLFYFKSISWFFVFFMYLNTLFISFLNEKHEKFFKEEEIQFNNIKKNNDLSFSEEQMLSNARMIRYNLWFAAILAILIILIISTIKGSIYFNKIDIFLENMAIPSLICLVLVFLIKNIFFHFFKKLKEFKMKKISLRIEPHWGALFAFPVLYFIGGLFYLIAILPYESGLGIIPSIIIFIIGVPTIALLMRMFKKVIKKFFDIKYVAFGVYS